MKQISISTLVDFIDFSSSFFGELDFSACPIIVKEIVYVPNLSISLEVKANIPVSGTNIDLVVPSK